MNNNDKQELALTTAKISLQAALDCLDEHDHRRALKLAAVAVQALNAATERVPEKQQTSLKGIL